MAAFNFVLVLLFVVRMGLAFEDIVVLPAIAYQLPVTRDC